MPTPPLPDEVLDLPPTHPDLVKVFWDADEGVDFLKYKRRKFK